MISNNRQAYTLVEMLVALAVGAIVVMATYASYEMVNTQYQKNTDIANMHTSGRAIMQMIERDVRMAGFEYRHTSGANKGKKAFGSKITKPLDITDSGNKCCDEVKVIYDYFNEDDQTVKRIQIHYFTKEHNTPKKGNRYRLYKQVNEILPNAKTGSVDVLADFVEDLQLVNVESKPLLWHGDRFNQNLNYAVIEKIPGKNSGTGNAWRRVKSIAIDSNGLLYTGSNYAWRDPLGIYIIDVKTDKDRYIYKGRLRGVDMASSMTFTPDGVLYSVHNSKLSAFYPDSSISYIGLPFNATAIASDDKGLLYMGSNSTKNIQIYNPKIRRNIGSIPTKTMSSRVVRVNDIAINGDKLFVASADHSSIQMYSILSRKNIGYIPTSYIKNAIVVGGPHNLLYSGSESRREIEVHNYNTAEKLGKIRTGDPISDLAISDNKSGKEALVNIKLTLRSEKEYGSNNRKYSKNEKAEQYQIGNYDFEFNDKYKHDVFATTVLVRNLAL